ncbi:hypothetical protein HY086_02640 [Candidatus Gottesmanbacteria bacterium]|nr:hypothetical protein [Candidatus Gottesmanbacteria bacterium]
MIDSEQMSPSVQDAPHTVNDIPWNIGEPRGVSFFDTSHLPGMTGEIREKRSLDLTPHLPQALQKPGKPTVAEWLPRRIAVEPLTLAAQLQSGMSRATETIIYDREQPEKHPPEAPISHTFVIAMDVVTTKAAHRKAHFDGQLQLSTRVHGEDFATHTIWSTTGTNDVALTVTNMGGPPEPIRVTATARADLAGGFTVKTHDNASFQKEAPVDLAAATKRTFRHRHKVDLW